ncbi:MAG: DMT family transporter [Treponemataceae bacterium]|nr:DMT family transporter [Treponemataceae bacterium]MDE7392228.1 DMT family transporter [Treponemataceae bacterium]
MREYLNPLVVSGYDIFFLAILLDMIALRTVPVSYLPVIESSSYVFVLFFSRIFLGERLARRQLAAILIILCGITMYQLQEQRWAHNGTPSSCSPVPTLIATTVFLG